MDAETIRLAHALGMQSIVCKVCRHITLFVANEKHTNTPKTCGLLTCGKALQESWAKDAHPS